MDLDIRQIVDGLPGLVLTAFADGRAEFLNQRWCQYTGICLDQAIGFGWHSAVHPDDLTPVLEHWRLVLASGQQGEVAARLRRQDGQYSRALFSTAPAADQSGRVVSWCDISVGLEARPRVADATGAHEDISASEHELRRAHRYLAEAQRLSRTGSFTADVVVDDHIWSEELYRIFEFEPGTKISVQTVRAALHPDDLPSFDADFGRSAREGTDFDQVFRIVTSSGKVKYLHAAAHILEMVEGRPVFIGAIQDVTDNKIAEESLTASEAELRRAHAHFTVAQRLSATGSFVSDLMADEHTWSEELYRICEFEPGTKVTVQKLRDILHRDDLETYDAVIERSMSGQDVDFEFRIITPRGAVKYLRAAARISKHIEGRPVLMGAVQDVTERKVAEDALNGARAELTHVARVMALSAVTASIAHEVNQPLSGIITNASTCLRMLDASPPNVDGARATAQRTLRDGNRAAEVVQRLRALFQRHQPTTDAVDLNDAAREVLALSSAELQRSRVILRTDFGENLPAVLADRVQLQQVILNLVLNAADAMRTIDDRPRDLLLTTTRESQKHVRLSVRDSGVGIDPQNVEKLFDAFYTTKSHGMGVGLSISRSIIESHEGRLWATANDEPGATFSFLIPCATQPHCQSAGQPHLPSHP